MKKIKRWRGIMLWAGMSIVGMGIVAEIVFSGIEPVLAAPDAATSAHVIQQTQRVVPEEPATVCVIVVNHGMTETTIQPDACVLAQLEQPAKQSQPEFKVMYKDTLNGIALPSVNTTLTAQAQKTIQNEILKYRNDFLSDASICLGNDGTSGAKLVTQDHLVNVWAEVGNPSQWVIDNAPFLQFRSGC